MTIVMQMTTGKLHDSVVVVASPEVEAWVVGSAVVRLTLIEGRRHTSDDHPSAVVEVSFPDCDWLVNFCRFV